MTETSSYAVIDELVDAGIIQESNRRFFHLLGLELVAALQADGSYSLKVRIQRSTTGGFVFEHREPDWSTVRQARARAIEDELTQAIEHRRERYGFDLQPIEDL